MSYLVPICKYQINCLMDVKQSVRASELIKLLILQGTKAVKGHGDLKKKSKR